MYLPKTIHLLNTKKRLLNDTYIALQSYGSFIGSLCLYKYTNNKDIFKSQFFIETDLILL